MVNQQKSSWWWTENEETKKNQWFFAKPRFWFSNWNVFYLFLINCIFSVLNLWTDLEESGTDFSIFSIFGDSLFLFVFDKSVGRSC
jgi:hypothetical protein